MAYFDAGYFRTRLHADSESLKDTPARLEIVLVTSERFAVYQVGEISQSCIGFQIYPQEPNQTLPEYPREDREAGMPRYRTELVVVPYSQIAQVRLSTGPLAKKMPTGFAAPKAQPFPMSIPKDDDRDE